MKYCLLKNKAPFVRGGAEILAESLKQSLEEYGHAAEIVEIPFVWQKPDDILPNVLAHRLLQLGDCDRVIGMKFPAYAIPHSNKVFWLVHQFRQMYDYWGTPYQPFPATPYNESIRNALINADTAYIQEASRIYTISDNVSQRLKHWNSIDSQVLYPPLPHDFVCEPRKFENVIYMPGRLSHSKRQHLAIESMRHVKENVTLVITGKPDTASYLSTLEKLITKYNLTDKVKIQPGWVSEDEKRDWYETCGGVLYIPTDEDAYGYVTLESYMAKKPVITCTDSGDTTILVKHNETGYVAEPEPTEIASSIDMLVQDTTRARELGADGYDHVQTLQISWETVVSTLTS